MTNKQAEYKNLPQSKDNYTCSECGEEIRDYEEPDGYVIGGEKYPIYYGKWYDWEGNANWKEVHVCEKCGVKFKIDNGV